MTRRVSAVSRWGLAFLTSIHLSCSLARAKTIFVNASTHGKAPIMPERGILALRLLGGPFWIASDRLRNTKSDVVT